MMNLTPDIAIIVLHFNTPEMTSALVSYLQNDLDYPNKKIYVIDNGSDEPLACSTHRLPENLGFTRGMHEGYRIASTEADYDGYWLLNSDVGFEFGNDVLVNLCQVLFSNESYAQIAPQHNSPHGFMERAGCEAEAVPYLEPVATLIKGSVVKALGFWDLALTYGWGVDYDYGYRVRRAGLMNILTNRARITHREHRSIADYPKFVEAASGEMRSVLNEKYGDGWWEQTTTMERRIVPLILSCERDVSLTERFVSSYLTVQAGLARPLVVVDISASPGLSARYLSLIASLDPRAVVIHSREPDQDLYNSVQEAVNLGFQYALKEAGPNDLILFIEDDIVFSSRFLAGLKTVEVQSDVGFISLYQPGNGYGAREIAAGQFYGTQCVLFPRKAAAEIADNWEELKKYIPPGYDIRWSRFLGERGYKLLCTDYSYVQHIGSALSRLHGHGSHTSSNFVA